MKYNAVLEDNKLKVKAGVATSFNSDAFTIVGTPNITDDGVINAKSEYIDPATASANAVFIPNNVLKQIGTNNWKLEWESKFSTTAVANELHIGSYWYATNNSPLSVGNFNVNPTFYWNLNLNDNGTIVKSPNYNTVYGNSRAGQNYKAIFEFKNGVYSLTLYFADGTNATSQYTSNLYFEPSTFNLGLGLNIEKDFDLKKVKLYINDVVVFNGTKTSQKLYAFRTY